MGRLKLYVAGSAVMANIVLARAYYERPNFYSAAVYISQSTGSLMFLVNLMLIVAASFGYGLQRLFYGPLRPIETEQLYDKAWFAVSETLLAMTIFRDDIGLWFFTMFLCLLAGKVWQWIGEGRVEFLEQQPPANPRLFHARLASSLLLSVLFDVYMTQYCVSSILSAARPGVMVMFGFEYVLLATASISTLMRYGLSLVEIAITQRQEKARDEARRVAREQARQQAAAEDAEAPAEDEEDEDDEVDVPGWEEKGRWVFYLDLATDFVKASVYMGFFTVLMTFYGIPIHIMRDLFMSVRSLIKRINDFIQYRNATRDMNTRYPDATGDDLSRENICIVCREEMRPWNPPGAEGVQPGRRVDERQRPKKLPCGHILHFSCLRSWLERQQVCPTCRRPVLGEATPQPGQPNNQANAAAPDQPNQPNAQIQGGLRGFLPGNAQQPPANQAQPGAPAPQGAQPNRPNGNMRVFNFGPFRLALGNLRLPAEQAGNANNVRNAIDQLRQQAVAGQVPQAPTQLPQGQIPTQALLPNNAPAILTDQMGAALAQQPIDIRYDILRIQQHIIQQLRHLNVQNEQLEVTSRLLVELNRLNTLSAAGQQVGGVAPMDTQNFSSFAPQAYFARDQVLRQGDAGMPEGLTIPEGWTLRPMAQAAQSAPASASAPASLPSESTSRAVVPVSVAEPAPVVQEAQALESQSQADATPVQPAPSVTTTPAGPTTSSSPKPAAPSSLESSWSFGDLPERNEAEGSSSAVAGSSSEGQNMTKRAVTVEDAEDNEQ
ncbi:E3 ubiquitin-protein ligase hrd1 [Didymella glomerata]|uniref:RING-type E3 ubiquitin transferase n=1 Tax=Didymella glomerata TaxID=749621 RepID=A0A9W9C2N5_9PLEO|nr:E3 ubiquitin-protein ligase hrd1 [Didymella glomerata]